MRLPSYYACTADGQPWTMVLRMTHGLWLRRYLEESDAVTLSVWRLP